ncbi:hypothetical protein FRB95_001734 [Tulasnella sp. JGI-2019a]|nr:hypothetical protein FRB95_001734 [Tulasnella sp. JGI-2019a]
MSAVGSPIEASGASAPKDLPTILADLHSRTRPWRQPFDLASCAFSFASSVNSTPKLASDSPGIRQIAPAPSSKTARSPANKIISDSIPGPGYDHELALLDGDAPDELAHEVVTAPLVTRDAYLFGGGLRSSIPQYGILGSIVSIHSQNAIDGHVDPRIYLNTNAPFSAVVCGVQGSGKSHTVGVLLESMMIPGDTRLGALQKPFAGLVLHYGENGGSRPCEAAYQCSTSDKKIRPPIVKVYVSPSRIRTMTKVYGDVFGKKVEIIPLKITDSELDAQAFLSMMCVSSGKEPPLYVQIILGMLRDIGENFSFMAFKKQLEEKKSDKEFNLAQLAGIKQRMSLLEAFLCSRRSVMPRFTKGQVTIVDLTDPFIDPASASSIFEIVTRLFVRAEVKTGKVLVVDEAHKYLTMGSGSSDLTKTLLSIVRQQRHLGM